MRYHKNIYGREFWKIYKKYLDWEPLIYYKIVKKGTICEQSGKGSDYYKVGQLVLQSGTGIRKWDNFITN